MFFNHRCSHLVYLVVIFAVGFGAALALPWLGNIQSQASEKAPEQPPTIEELVKEAERAYAFAAKSKIYSPAADPLCFATHNDGTDEFSSLDASAVQDAVEAASTGDIVKVAGSCLGVEVQNGETQTVYISKSLILEGGHTQKNWTLEPNPEDFPTLLHANNLGRVILITGTVDVIINNLNLFAGKANTKIGILGNPGGGIYSNGSLTLTNTTVYSNTAFNGAGLASDQNSHLYLKNVTFLKNNAGFNGGGLFTFNINPTLEFVDFTENKAYWCGGGMMSSDGNLTLKDGNFTGNDANWGGGLCDGKNTTRLTNVTFINNSASDRGGGLYNEQNQSTMTNTLFSGNKAMYGGGIYNEITKLTQINTTFSGNNAEDIGGGMFFNQGASYVYNSIFWNNQDNSGPGTINANIYIENSGKISLANSIVESSGGSGSWVLDPTRYIDGENNKDTDPLFVEPVHPAIAPTAGGDLHLTDKSPAIDMGNDDYISVIFDLDHHQRIVDGNRDGTPTVDMGALEYQIPYIYDIYLPIILN
jgi:predicted outer membrane repeat protein